MFLKNIHQKKNNKRKPVNKKQVIILSAVITAVIAGSVSPAVFGANEEIISIKMQQHGVQTVDVFAGEGAFIYEPEVPGIEMYSHAGWYADDNTAARFSEIETKNALNASSLACLELGYWYQGIDEETYSTRLKDACYAVPNAGTGYCAAWVSYVYQKAGLGFIGGDAIDFWINYGVSDNIFDIKEGMIIAVPHSPTSQDGWTYGHVGVLIKNPSYQEPEEDREESRIPQYVSSGNVQYEKDSDGHEKWLVADSTSIVQSTPLSSWIAKYNATNQVLWGWAHYYQNSGVEWTGDIPSYIPFVVHQSTPAAPAETAQPQTDETQPETQEETQEETTSQL